MNVSGKIFLVSTCASTSFSGCKQWCAGTGSDWLVAPDCYIGRDLVTWLLNMASIAFDHTGNIYTLEFGKYHKYPLPSLSWLLNIYQLPLDAWGGGYTSITVVCFLMLKEGRNFCFVCDFNENISI